MLDKIFTIIKVTGILGIILYIINLTFINNDLHNKLTFNEVQLNTLQNDKDNLEKILKEQNAYIETLKVNTNIINDNISKNKELINNKYSNKIQNSLKKYNTSSNKIEIIDRMLHEFSKNN